MDVQSGVALNVQHLCAWAPGRDDPAAWQAWAQNVDRPSAVSAPDVRHVDAMLRRRMSPLSRMLVSVCHRVLLENAGADVAALVFASRHGELRTTVPLIQQLLLGEPLSPMGFALSVHNTAAGLQAIASQDSRPALTLAAGADTLAAGLLEAWMQAQALASPVLFAYAEEALPPPYLGRPDDQADALALAVLIAPNCDGRRLGLRKTVGTASAAAETRSPAEALLGAWYGGNGHDRNGQGGNRVAWAGEQGGWSVELAS